MTVQNDFKIPPNATKIYRRSFENKTSKDNEMYEKKE